MHRDPTIRTALLPQELIEPAQQFFEHCLGVAMDDLLRPINPVEPGGVSLATSDEYRAIRLARSADDPTLPQGAWTHELKRADWDRVTAIALDVLQHKSKDLQVAAWLLEAQIARRGFDAIGPCLVLMACLCDAYWESLHPRIDGGDLEHRANIVNWVNEKLLPGLRLLPITAADDGRREYGWSDYEQALRHEKVRAIRKQPAESTDTEGVSFQAFQDAVANTRVEHFEWLEGMVAYACAAASALGGVLDGRWTGDAPGLSGIAGLLQEIGLFVSDQMTKRGAAPLGIDTKAGEPADSRRDSNYANTRKVRLDANTEQRSGSDIDISSRADAYLCIEAAMRYLQTSEPHSPVSHLLRRAIEWGKLCSSELIFNILIKSGGKIDLSED